MYCSENGCFFLAYLNYSLTIYNNLYFLHTIALKYLSIRSTQLSKIGKLRDKLCSRTYPNNTEINDILKIVLNTLPPP